jgi:hypothetical protein
MLDDSFPYKRQLRRDLGAVRNTGLIDDDRAWLRFERFVFWSAFVIRKLSEAKKLSDEFEGERFKITRHPATDLDGFQDHMNAHRVESHYDFAKSEVRTVAPLWIASQLVHSFSFLPEIDDAGRPAGLYFNSDRSRKTSLFHLPWGEFERLILLTCDDDIVAMRFNRITGELRKWRDPPDEIMEEGLDLSQEEAPLPE